MTVTELLIAFALGLMILFSVLWLAGANKKPFAFAGINSAAASGVLIVCAIFFDTVLKLNALTVFCTSLLGFAGILLLLIMSII